MESIHQSPADRDPNLWRQAKARVGFRMHVRSYLIVNAGLWLIWAASTFTFNSLGHSERIFPWPIFPMIGWGIGLASHYFMIFRGGNERDMIEQEYKKLVNQL